MGSGRGQLPGSGLTTTAEDGRGAVTPAVRLRGDHSRRQGDREMSETPRSYGEFIPTRERCAACQRVSPISFWVPNEMWRAVVHPSFQNSILCVQCFISRADEKLIDWSAEIKLYPMSMAAQLQNVRGLKITPFTAAERKS